MMSVQEGKKKKHGRINQEDVFVINYSGDALREKDVSTKLCVSHHLLTGKLGHWRALLTSRWYRVGSRKQVVAQILLWWLILSVSPVLWALLSFLASACLSPLLFPSPFLPQRD